MPVNKGLLVWVYENEMGEDQLSVLPKGTKRLILCGEGIPEIFEESPDCPAVMLVKNAYNTVKAVPVNAVNKPAMYGGRFVSTSDSRFSDVIENLLGHRFYGAVPLHDRVEG